MDRFVALADNRVRSMTASWLASCLLHGGLAIAATFFVHRMQLAPQAEPFQWNVAMVASLSPSTGSPSPTASTVPSTPALRQLAQPAPPAQQAVRSLQAKISTPVPSPPEPIAEPHQSQNRSAESHSQDLTSSVPTDSPFHTSLQDRSASSAVTEPVSPVHDSSPHPLESQVATDSPFSLASSGNASTASADQLRSAKADYGWLTDLMSRWIEDLNKRYPATLRTQGVQGKVMLTAMLHENGLLNDVRVVKSSGNAALDEVAVEDVKNGPPINLSRPLERTPMPVKFSISYDLRATR